MDNTAYTSTDLIPYEAAVTAAGLSRENAARVARLGVVERVLENGHWLVSWNDAIFLVLIGRITSLVGEAPSPRRLGYWASALATALETDGLVPILLAEWSYRCVSSRDLDVQLARDSVAVAVSLRGLSAALHSALNMSAGRSDTP